MQLFLDAVFSSIALNHFMIDTFNASRPVLLTYLGMTESEIAIFTTIYIWVSALTQPFFGWLSDRMGPRWLASGSVLWMAVFYAGALAFPGDTGLASLVIAALGSSAFHPVGAVQATLRGRELLQGRETTATAIFFMAGQMGHFIGPIITGLILFRYQIPGLFIISIIAVPFGLALAHQLRANQPHPKAAAASNTRVQAGVFFVLVLMLVATLQSWAQSNMVNLIPKYIKDLGQDATVYGSMAGLFMGGSAIGNLFGGYFGDRHSKRLVAASALFLAALPIYGMSLIGWSWWLYLLVPLSGALTGAVHSIIVVFAQRIIPGGMALASGLILGFIFSSGALGLIYTGHLAETYGFPYVLVMTAGMVILAAPFTLLLKESSAKPV